MGSFVQRAPVANLTQRYSRSSMGPGYPRPFKVEIYSLWHETSCFIYFNFKTNIKSEYTNGV